MKVKELIELLKGYDQEAELVVTGAYGSEGSLFGVQDTVDYSGVKGVELNSDVCSG